MYCYIDAYRYQGTFNAMYITGVNITHDEKFKKIKLTNVHFQELFRT